MSRALKEEGGADPELLGGSDVVAASEEKDLHSFEIDPAQVLALSNTETSWFCSGVGVYFMQGVGLVKLFSRTAVVLLE